jgi:hypothetical protein
MSRPSVRRAAVAALLPLAMASLVACGGSDDPKAVEPSTSDSTSTTTDPSESASDVTTPSASASTSAGSPVDHDEFMGVFRNAFENATTSHMTMTSGGTGAELTAEGVADYSTSPLSMALTMESPQFGDGVAEMRLVDGTFYIKLPMLGTKFIKFDLDDPSNPFGTVLTDQLDPRSMFDGFEKGLKEVTYVGSEDVNGETMDHYQVTVDSSAILDQAGQEAPSGVTFPKDVTYGMFFDGDGLFRKMRVDLGTTAGSLEVNYDKWGEPVTIEAPAPNEITTMPGA